MKAKPWSDSEDGFLRQFYVSRGVAWCAENLERSPGAVSTRAFKIGLGRMKGETLQVRLVDGYMEVYIGSYRAMLHQLVGELLIGRPLMQHEIAHHRDGNKLNNDPSNIEVMDRAAHQRAHWGPNCDGRRDPKTGKFQGVGDIVRTSGKPEEARHKQPDGNK
jgi:hypothetical protein